MALIRELSVKTKERIIKLPQEENLTQFVAKDVDCFHSAVSKFGGSTKNGKVIKGKHIWVDGRQKTQRTG